MADLPASCIISIRAPLSRPSNPSPLPLGPIQPPLRIPTHNIVIRVVIASLFDTDSLHGIDHVRAYPGTDDSLTNGLEAAFSAPFEVGFGSSVTQRTLRISSLSKDWEAIASLANCVWRSET